MIVKEHEIPVYLEKLEALERRLPQSHAKYQSIVDNYSKRKAGYQGENPHIGNTKGRKYDLSKLK
jgi:hypothetical protein